jgi:hypothetical protein
MAYTVNQLIADAYYASGIVSREFETVTGPEEKDALRWLNEILDTLIVEPDIIPYETTYEFNAVIGQEAYQIDNLIFADTLVFYLNSVRFPMTKVPRDIYFGQGRVQNIQSLPYQYYVERDMMGATLYMYFLPNQAYPCTLHGVFRLSNVALGQDLDLTLNTFYQVYLKFMLAVRICNEYSRAVPMGCQSELDHIRAKIQKQSRPLDMSVKKYSTLHQQTRMGWAFVNLGNGFLPD